MLTHHAYYIEGPLAQFNEYTEALKPFWAVKFERFGIDEARELIELTSLKQVGRGVYVVGIVSITTEAQQALLKLFEEPQPGVVFVVLVPHGVLLPTVRSRMLEYPHDIALESHVTGQGRAFLKMTGKERSDYIAKMLKDDEGVKENARAFVDALEVELHKKVADKKAQDGLRDIAMVRDYLRDRSPSLKMLLEHLALSLPTL